MPSQKPDPRGDGGAAQPGGEVALVGNAGAASRSSRAGLEHGPPAVAVPVLGRRSPSPAAYATAWIASAPTSVHGNSPAPAVRRSRARTCRVDDAGAPAGDVDDDAAVRRDQLAQRARAGRPGRRRCRCCRRRAGPSPSGPRPASGRRRRAAGPARPGRGSAAPPRARRRCRARRGRAGPGPRPSGPARSRCRASGPGSGASSASVGRVGVARARRASAAAARARSPSDTRARVPCAGRGCRRWPPGRVRHDGHRAPPARRAGSGRRSSEPATASASSTVSTSRSSCADPDGLSGRGERVRGCGRRCPAATSVRRPAPAAAVGSLQGQHPPAAVRRRARARRSPLARPRATSRQVGGGELRGVHPDLDGRARTRPRRRGRGPAARRTSVPRCGWTIQPVSWRAQRVLLAGVREVAVEREVALVEGRAAGGEGVEERGGGQPGRRLHPDLRAEPGLHPPGTGAFATTSALMPRPRQHLPEVAGGARSCPAPMPLTFERCRPRAGGRRRRAPRAASRRAVALRSSSSG